MFNFLFCFDDNYNKQAEVAMYSILEQFDEKLNINIIHKRNALEISLSKKITSHKNINNLSIYQFIKPDNLEFENLANVHVSEATYYRLFLSDYLDKSFDNLIYVDCDIVCVKDFSVNLENSFKKLEKSKYIVAAIGEYEKSSLVQKYHSELQLQNNDYFNAGVMLINYKKWIEFNVGEKLIETLFELKGRITFWDQDVMNKFFDGNYYKLENGLNKRFTNDNTLNNKIITQIEAEDSNIFLLHFAGKFKPWHVNGSVVNGSHLFHDYFYEINSYKPFIQIRNRKNSLKQLFSINFLNNLKNKENKMNILFNIILSISLKKNIVK